MYNVDNTPAPAIRANPIEPTYCVCNSSPSVRYPKYDIIIKTKEVMKDKIKINSIFLSGDLAK